MSQEQRTLVAISMMLGLILVYQAFFAPKRPVEKPPAVPAASQPAAPAVTPPAAPAPNKAEAPPAEREIPVETKTLTVTLTTRGGGVKSWRLKDYVVAGEGPVDIVAPAGRGEAPPLAAWGYMGLPGPETQEADRTALRLTGTEEQGAIVFSRRDPNGLRTEKRLRFHSEGYTVDVELRLRNEGREDIPVEPKAVWGPGFRESQDKAKAAAQRAPTTWVDDGRAEDHPKDIKPGAPRYHKGAVAWTALQDTYFAAALIPETKGDEAFTAVAEDGQPWVGLQAPPARLRPGQEALFRFKVYGGPKDISRLAAAAPQLDHLVNLGSFFFGSWSIIDYGLARPGLWLLQALHRITGNYGLAIILLTVLLKAAMFPLTQKSLKSMQAMQALQPKIQAIKEKYKNNPQKRNQEMADLMRRHKVSGAAGCLPMLAQMPVFIGLYNALSNSIDLWQARFLWVKDLSAPEHGLFAFAGIDFRPLPLLMGATQFLQMKLSPSAADPAQAAIMTYFMPIFMTFIFYSFPSGLVLYWLCFNALQIGQQYLLNKAQAQKAAAPAG
jgi:YidC/Oxa1 family membrane protein insertase